MRREEFEVRQICVGTLALAHLTASSKFPGSVEFAQGLSELQKWHVA